MTRRLLTATKITAWLDCEHYLTLRHATDAGRRPAPPSPFGSFAQMLLDKGLAHEADVLARYEADGRRVFRVDDKARGETFTAWAERAAPILTETDADVVFQMPFVQGDVRGVADFLERELDDDGNVRWEPVDAKLARNAAKPGHLLQLCFYAEAIAAATGVAPARLQVSLGSGTTLQVGYEDVRPYWARLRIQLDEVLHQTDGHTETADETRPEPCDHCTFCEFETTCEGIWRAEDSLVFVAGIRTDERHTLEAAGVGTLAALATRTDPVEDVRAERLERLGAQARLQVAAREEPDDDPPPFEPIEPGDDPMWGRGFEQLPDPDDADVFLDFEGHPFWRADRGLFFLFGYVAQDSPDEWAFDRLWAHDGTEEREQVRELIAYVRQRRAEHPGMHVYHYNHTERSSLERLTADYAVSEQALADLVDAGVFVDLLPIVRNAVQIGVESYGLKYVERLTDYERRHEIDRGASAVVAFEAYTDDGDPAHLDAIADYNEDDVRATRALRDWLVDHRPDDLDWPSPDEEVEADEELDALIEALAAHGIGTPGYLLADLLGYWIREWRAYIAPIVAHLTDDPALHPDEPTLLAALDNPRQVSRLTPTGRDAKWPGLQLDFPVQPLDRAFEDGGPKKVMYLSPDGLLQFAEAHDLDRDARTLTLVWNGAKQEEGTIPTSVVADEWVSPRSKYEAIDDLARQVLDPDTHGTPNPVTLALLAGDPPRFRAGGGPTDGVFTDDTVELGRWATELDGGVLAVQGPPGTGKTYRGAHMAKVLVAADKRVGIMAMSNAAIDNLLTEIVEVFAADPPLELRALRKGAEPDGGGLPGVSYTTNNADLADPDFAVVAGTAWQFASRHLRGEPVDVLLVDEAGQLALVDAVVGSMAAASVVLLGDPLQLPQVAQASHPRGSGASALSHILGEEETMPIDLGVFIEQTRRMHPDVCRFISDRIYGGRLASHPECAYQDTAEGTGLRWLRVEHTDCATESVAEAEAVTARIGQVIGQTWTDKTCTERTIGPADIMVVAPYNDQVRLLRSYLGADPVSRGVPVGTVDKFQGCEAPVVFFTMTSSSAEDMPRGTEFLFSRNRLNVAISRAQCLAHLVCTERLLHSRARTIDDMLLIATLCAFVEYAVF